MDAIKKNRRTFMDALRKYGFALILFIMFLVSMNFMWDYQQKVSYHEAQEHKQTYSQQEAEDEYWLEFWANHQSEYAQLLLQVMGTVIMANYIFRKANQETDEIKESLEDLHMKVDALL